MVRRYFCRLRDMAYKDPEVRKAKDRERYERTREQQQARSRKYYDDNRDKVLARTKANRAELREAFTEWKLIRGCQVCGYRRCAQALDAHHLRDKEFTVGESIAKNISLKKLASELEKCVVLCANHHRELHAGVIEI